LSARRGSYVNTGDTVAEIGELGTLRVRVYVDEPELGRVAEGMPAVITWDAMPERQWKGTVEKMPTQIVALGTRQVGEVIVTIENADQSLLPGTNINAEIIPRWWTTGSPSRRRLSGGRTTRWGFTCCAATMWNGRTWSLAPPALPARW
ncbi:MAG TPA: efflux RND transporter periplasmic adaptor subunit, partial [Bryobacteraceae bacterium]|nr:efflux RND transporter periplasmic adaptor subunit [Bryobacteraceae bacterium]